MNYHQTVREWKNFLHEKENFIDKSTFVIRDNLHDDFWVGGKLKSYIRRRLMQITKDFFESLGLDDAVLKDVTFTGSLANYNWSKFSDIDLHLVVDFAEVGDDTELVKEMFNGKRFKWNYLHNIPINGFEVEIYVQNEGDSHESTGVYSVYNDEWLTKPTQVDPDIDWENVEKKVNSLMDQVDRVQKLYDEGEYAEAHAHSTRLKEKLARFRQSGLEREGAFSPENIAFKVLRRNEYLAKLSGLKINSYDKKMSIVRGNGVTVKVGNLVKGWKEYLQEREMTVEVPTHQANVRVAINRITGLTKSDTFAYVRSIPGVTTVNTVPGSVADGLTSFYQTLSIKFCCAPGVDAATGLYLRKTLLGDMRKIKGLTVVRVVGGIETIQRKED